MFVAFKLKNGRDKDLIDWIESLGDGDRSYHIRDVLRRGINMQVPSALPAMKILPKEKGNSESEIIDLDKNMQKWMTV